MGRCQAAVQETGADFLRLSYWHIPGLSITVKPIALQSARNTANVSFSGEKVGVREIARLAKVSVGTVDRALNGRPEVSESTRKRVLEIAAKHGYTPHPA